jgi:hypothetical protein
MLIGGPDGIEMGIINGQHVQLDCDQIVEAVILLSSLTEDARHL